MYCWCDLISFNGFVCDDEGEDDEVAAAAISKFILAWSRLPVDGTLFLEPMEMSVRGNDLLSIKH